MMISSRMAERFSLREITPTALSHYARSKGWIKVGVYGEYSDIYATDGKPEIVVPRSDIIGDYELVVSDLIEIFSKVLNRNDTSVYRDLTVADRDVMRVKALEASPDGLPFENAHAMVVRTRDMLVAAANSLGDTRRVYRANTGGKVADYLRKMRLGDTESGSFALVLISPPIAPQSKHSTFGDRYDVSPMERRVTERLSEALFAVRYATENMNRGYSYGFEQAVEYGVSANLCEAVGKLAQSVSTFDISFNWAMTHPSDAIRGPVSFSREDVPILKKAASNFRMPELEYGRLLSGFVYRLTRDRGSRYGIVSMRASVEGTSRSVVAELDKRDYERAAETHTYNSRISLIGDLERVGQRLYLRNASVAEHNIGPNHTQYG